MIDKSCLVGNPLLTSDDASLALVDLRALDWSLLSYDPQVISNLPTLLAERRLKAHVPWAVRGRLVWDFESSMIAAYGLVRTFRA